MEYIPLFTEARGALFWHQTHLHLERAGCITGKSAATLVVCPYVKSIQIEISDLENAETKQRNV